MRRAVAAGVVAVLAAVLAGAAGAVTGDSSPGPSLTARAFSVDAEGYPVEPGVGAQQFAVPFRPTATRSSLANAPVSAYARSAFVDLGPAELYTAPNFPPPDSVAECDTARPNVPLSAATAPAAMRLDVHCDKKPASSANADGSGIDQPGVKARSASSHTAADAGDALTASADSTLADADVGPVHIGSARFHGEVSADGRPGGAKAAGSVVVSESTVNGIPVVFGPDGVEVDENKVPLELVPSATDAVHQALSQDGYSDVRLAQPQAVVAPDGTKASVSGGGLQFFGSSNDPQNNYFTSLNLVGGKASVALGASLETVSGSVEVAAPSAPALSSAMPSLPAGGSLFSTPAAAAAAAPPPAPSIQPRLVGTRARYDLPGGGMAWLWILVGSAAGVAGAVVFRRPLARSWHAVADRYVRG